MSTASPLPARRRYEDVAVLIPAWQPDAALLSLVPELIYGGFSAIIVVDDGSGPEYQDLFETIARYPEAHLVRHGMNRGKGRAWKSGMSYFLNAFPDFRSLIMADADGRHTPEDILLTAQAWTRSPQCMVVGTCRSSGAVPWRSRLEGRINRYIFGLLTKGKLADTPGGLYALPRAMVPDLLTLPGEGRGYEMAMLAHAFRSGQPPVEATAWSIYRESKGFLRFHPVRDFLCCCLILFRFGRS